LGLNVLIRARNHYVGKERKADCALAFGKGTGKGITGEGSGEAVATAKDIPHPLSAEGCGH
jgi:hypothetical protein